MDSSQASYHVVENLNWHLSFIETTTCEQTTIVSGSSAINTALELVTAELREAILDTVRGFSSHAGGVDSEGEESMVMCDRKREMGFPFARE